MKTTLTILLLIIIHLANAQNVADQFAMGKRYFKAKDYARAKKKFNYVISQNTAYYEAYTYRARVYLEMKMPDSALLDFKTSIKQKEGYLPAHYYRAKYYFGIQEYDKCKKDLDKVISQKSDFMPAILLRAQIYEKQGKEDLAFADYNSAIAKGTRSYEVYYRRGLYFSKHAQNLAAIKDFDKCIALKRSFTDAWFAKANSQQILGEYSEAVRLFSEVVKQNVDYQAAYERRAYIYFILKDYKASLENDKYLLTHFRMREDTIYIHIAKAEIELGDLSRADRSLAKAYSTNPKNEEALFLRAELAIKRGKASTALQYLRRLTRLNKDNYEAWYLYGKINFNDKKYKKAIENLNQSIKAQKSGKAYYLRGAAYYALKDKTKACIDTQKAAKLGHRQAKKDVGIICK